MKRGAIRQPARVTKKGLWNLGGEAAADATRRYSQGGRSFNVNRRKMRVGATTSYEAKHPKVKIAPESRGHGPKRMGDRVESASPGLFLGAKGPLNNV